MDRNVVKAKRRGITSDDPTFQMAPLPRVVSLVAPPDPPEVAKVAEKKEEGVPAVGVAAVEEKDAQAEEMKSRDANEETTPICYRYSATRESSGTVADANNKVGFFVPYPVKATALKATTIKCFFGMINQELQRDEADVARNVQALRAAGFTIVEELINFPGEWKSIKGLQKFWVGELKAVLRQRWWLSFKWRPAMLTIPVFSRETFL
jgi:hypothetical protein